MEITYLLNSGFLIRDERILLVFDDYADPSALHFREPCTF